MTVIYEHVRIAPKGELEKDLFKRSLEEELYIGEYYNGIGISESEEGCDNDDIIWTPIKNTWSPRYKRTNDD